MEKISIGVDVSKNSFDVCFMGSEKEEFAKYDYNQEGIKTFVKRIKSISEGIAITVTMEGTGSYYLKLTTALTENNISVSVVNPLKIKRFSEMKGYRTKTDKADAKIIAFYDAEQPFEAYNPKSPANAQIGQILSCIEGYIKTRTQTSNRLEALNNVPESLKSKLCEKSLLETINNLNATIACLEKELEKLIKDNYQVEAKRLKSIPGVGERTASAIIAVFGKFEHFKHAKQAISFIGLEPAIKQSGISIKGQASISKKGNAYMRGLLYMSAMSAHKFNRPCEELYKRLKQKGKPSKLAMVAVGNKLLRQMFAILKNQTFFDPEYQRT